MEPRTSHPSRRDAPPSPEEAGIPGARELPDPGVSTAPQPAPLPDFTVPAFEPFSYESRAPLSPADIDVITAFNALYMQRPGIGADQKLARDAVRAARGERGHDGVLVLLQRQYELACQGVGGASSQEAQQVHRNIQWVEELLRRASAAGL